MQDLEHPGLRVRALRQRLGLSQEVLAERGQLSRIEIVKVEGGSSKMSSYRMRSGLARAFGLSAEQFDALLAGELSVEDAHAAVTPADPAPSKTGTDDA